MMNYEESLSLMLLGDGKEDVHQERKHYHPVYSVWRERVRTNYATLRAEWDIGGVTKEALMIRTRGIKCYMNQSNIFKDVKVVQQALKNFSQRMKITPIMTSDVLGDPCSLEVVYSPDSSPLDMINSGTPDFLTELSTRSTLLWQLKSMALRLKDGTSCKLHSSTSFFLPKVGRKVTQQPDLWNMDLVIMSTLENSLDFVEKKEKKDLTVTLGRLIYKKILIPFLVALKQNQSRKAEGLQPYTRLILGDIGLRAHSQGVNSLFANTLVRVCKQYPVFREVCVRCSNLSTYFHLETLL
jgi:hypothetical protein